MAPASRRQQPSQTPNTTTGHTPAASSSYTPQPPAPAQLAYFVIFNPTLAAAKSKSQPQQPPPDAAAVTRAEGQGEGDKGDGGPDGAPQETPDAASTGDPAAAPTTALTDCSANPPPPPPPAQVDPGTRDRDLEDDLREAAQIVFYTSREAGGVSRDTMLRQVGLAKGLMGFADMASAGSSSSDPFWAVHTQNIRLIIYTPEPDWYVYVCVTLALVPAHSKTSRPSSGDKEHVETVPAQGISDRMLVDALQRGYDDFVLLHGKFGAHTSPTALAGLEKYWTRFAFGFESEFLAPSYPDFLAWLGGHDPPPPQPDTRALDTFAADLLPAASGVGFVGQGGPQTSAGTVPDAESREAAALMRLLVSTLAALRPAVERDPPAVRSTAESTSDRQTLGFGFGRRRLHIPAVTPAPPSSSVKDKDKDDRKSSWGPLAWVGLGSTPASRAVTPSPGAVPCSSAAQPATASAPVAIPGRASPAGSVASVDAKDKGQQLKNGSVSTTASTSTKSRWPSFGLGGLETVGHALGLSAAPSPKPDKEEVEKGQVAAEESKVEEAAEVPNEEGKDEGQEAAKGIADTAGEETGGEEESPKASLESATGKNAPTDGPGSETVDATTTPPDPAASPAEPVDTAPIPKSPANPDDLAAATTEPLDTTLTPAKDTDSVSVAETVVSVSQTPVLLPDLVAANDDRVNVTWGSKGVWLAGARRRLSYVVRDSLLLYILYPDADPREPPSGASTVALFDAVVPALASAAAAGSTPRANPPPERVPPDTTIYHSHDITERRNLPAASLDPAVAELRDILASGAVTEVYAQTSSARFAVAKRGKETGAELFVLTGRKDASLTDAERAVRAYSYVREV